MELQFKKLGVTAFRIVLAAGRLQHSKEAGRLNKFTSEDSGLDAVFANNGNSQEPILYNLDSPMLAILLGPALMDKLTKSTTRLDKGSGTVFQVAWASKAAATATETPRGPTEADSVDDGTDDDNDHDDDDDNDDDDNDDDKGENDEGENDNDDDDDGGMRNTTTIERLLPFAVSLFSI